ncbi:hypothetical protein AAZX31_07G178200 [Glycine max]|uniref:Tyrosinase copper-binding domain-containing protein n=1 Tax=Glycine max TaxID=3847 RepID=K7L2P1_SOYBN|nr:polyphenol oxidase II, chloroplastic [Glycine max]KAG5023313.1 hypothetical protein JHK85_019655 [Glycine max]KAG5038396.1 hypothetical protein JHK86_019236 [Glycine max]KAG5143521.1 hypothetical protein JHK82_019216 [Glycine max]KAH1087592.1 hypothetical protein GYH30_018925 [Glycine max]KAH1242934.1 Polyphenol oxidase latent form, chloroplastic [Glycine max]|eukprot:XP_006583808.1 polyphenol oxidase II, chloroplastic [Glycine max]
MASSTSHPSFWSLLNLSASIPISSSVCMFPPSKKPSKATKRRHAWEVACNGNPRNRRDILIGLGGLYGATTSLTSNNTGSAFGASLSPPDPTNCVQPDPEKDPFCPPPPFKDYELPPHDDKTLPLRIRPAAHLVTDDYIAKYEEAVRRMQDLPPDDPRSFMQQANVHRAYCDGRGYNQKGFADYKLDVHGSWIFFPWHRWYLYFYEKILGKMIDDPTFALPFWNWDNPAGMRIPPIFTDKSSPLYDEHRNSDHVNAFIDLDYKKDHSPVKPPQTIIWPPVVKKNNSIVDNLIVNNLIKVYTAVASKTNSSPDSFLGPAFEVGSDPKKHFGSLESLHNTVHSWTGELEKPNHDMGLLATAARDPIFFAHHSNVDRMWNIWKTELLDGRRFDHKSDEWLESSFFFYDENSNYVRVKVKDCLDSKKMGYDYQRVDLPWLLAGELIKPKKEIIPLRSKPEASTFKTLQLPLLLESIERTNVKRPKPRSRNENEEEEGVEEVLVIDVEYDSTDGVRFDVFINDQGDNEIGPQDSEFAGSFVTLPHSPHVNHNNITRASFKLPLTYQLKDLGVTKDDDSISVTLAPIYGDKPVTIKDVRIKRVYPEVDDE